MALVKIMSDYMTGAIVTTLNPDELYEFFPCYIHDDYTYVYIEDGYTNKLVVPFTEIALPDPQLDTFTRVIDPVILESHNLPEGQP